MRVLLPMLLITLASMTACGDGSALAAGEERTIPPIPDALAYRSGRPTITIIEPAPGATVESPVRFKVEAKNLELQPAGRAADGEGHLHVLVDQDCLDPGTEFPKNARSVHVSDGSDRIELDLLPGRHEVCIQVGDGFHVAVAVLSLIHI